MRDFQSPGRSPVLAENGICATSHPLAAKVALDILERGGNAMDAAIAGAVLLGICEPQSTGLGGDAFCLFSLPGSDEVRALNASGRAPAGFDADAARTRGATIGLHSVDAITLPGAIDGFCRLSEDHGRLGLADVLAPAIGYAEEGVPVAPRVAFDYARSAETLSGAGVRHYLGDGKPLAVGQKFRATGQAEVLRQVAENGRAGFYEADVARDMVQSLAALGGVHTMEDFAEVRCDYTDPVRGGYGPIELLEHPPNGQGATAILMLNMLSQFDLSAMDPLGADRAHIEAEVAKLAYDARDRFIADQAHMTEPDRMLSMETARALAALIDPARALPPSLPGAEAVHKDTVYITVVDRDRMCVSMIYSIFHSFGSGHASEKYGILFQNRGAGFTLEKGHPNEAAPGKRPMHTIIPGMVRRGGRVEMPFGVMGGAYQPNGHARFLTNMEVFGMDAQSAIDAPRAFPEDGTLRLETGYGTKVAQDLANRGHDLRWTDSPIGGAQAIRIRGDGVLEGASDPRKDGIALGY
ncbi:MAG: gamma-glutamyltransferase [Alphaproteobacteria bacterium]|jgi:gamma-glutamyltranspeptidase/glutathione hydrolase|nr:gamma-glutamyltransferase [Alphaproteobacteria bacterium]